MLPLLPIGLLVLATAASGAALAPRQNTTCPPGQTWCQSGSGRCVDLLSDVGNCGECGRGCATWASQCIEGECICWSGEVMCWKDPPCPFFHLDRFNCGACDVECANNQLCVDGVCTDCPANQYACGGEDPYNNPPATCIDTRTDADNCGGCGYKCAIGASCDAMQCKCPPGTDVCEGTVVTPPGEYPASCQDILSDNTHCGGCSNFCNGDCVNGSCRPCGAGLTRCYYGCVNIQNDNRNCGGCGNGCDAGANCVNGNCEQNSGCGPGQIRCSTGCTNPANDNRHCGACDAQCSPGKNCREGLCS